MRFIGVDPGAINTGVAVLEGDGTFSVHGEYANPLDVWATIRNECARIHDPDNSAIVILENFLGSGRLNNYKYVTIRIVGYLYWRCLEAAIPVRLIPNQARLANVGNVPEQITGKDEIAAAAHALTARERWPYQ